jgi:phage shock protein C
MEHRLYRSRANRMVSGVCGGLGEYLGLDPTWIRLAFLAFTLAGGAGILIYILMLIIVPENPNQVAATLVVSDQQPGSESGPGEGGSVVPETERTRNAMLFGAIIIVAGAFLLLRNLGLGLFEWFDGDFLWPLLLIAGGGLLLWRYLRQE